MHFVWTNKRVLLSGLRTITTFNIQACLTSVRQTKPDKDAAKKRILMIRFNTLLSGCG